MNYTKIYRTDIARLLDPGDQVLVIVPYRLAHGAAAIEWTSEEAGHGSRYIPRRLRDRVADTQEPGGRSLLDRILGIFSPNWSWNNIDWDKVIGGTSVTGRSDSPAGRLYTATREGVSLFGVVTAQRFAVVRNIATDRFEPVAEVSRAQVVSARRRGKPLQRGRVVIGFADGSHIAVSSGILFTGQARRLVTALSPQ
jgi:hypothetical protein